jgi:hypothetical protein
MSGQQVYPSVVLAFQHHNTLLPTIVVNKQTSRFRWPYCHHSAIWQEQLNLQGQKLALGSEEVISIYLLVSQIAYPSMHCLYYEVGYGSKSRRPIQWYTRENHSSATDAWWHILIDVIVQSGYQPPPPNVRFVYFRKFDSEGPLSCWFVIVTFSNEWDTSKCHICHFQKGVEKHHIILLKRIEESHRYFN